MGLTPHAWIMARLDVIRAALGMGRPAERKPPAQGWSQRGLHWMALCAAAGALACASLASLQASAQNPAWEDQTSTQTVSISNAATVDEGETLRFTVELGETPEAIVHVPYTVSLTTGTIVWRDVTTDPAGCTTDCSLAFAPGTGTRQAITITTEQASGVNAATITVTLGAAEERRLVSGTYDPGPPVVETPPTLETRAVASVSPNTATGSIRDVSVSGAQFVSISNAQSVYEGRALRFDVSLSVAPTEPVVVAYTVAATREAQYVDAGGGTLRFEAGPVNLQQIVIDTVRVAGSNSDETITVTLTGATSGSTPSLAVDLVPATGVVRNAAYVVSISDATAVDEGESLQFRVTIDRSPTTNVSVSYSVVATGASIYTGCTTNCPSITFSSGGATTQTITIDTVEDVVTEIDGLVIVSLTRATGAVIGDGEARGSVFEPRSPMVSVSDAAAVTEGGSLAFTVTLDRTPKADIAVSYLVSTTGANIYAGCTTSCPDVTFSAASGDTTRTITIQTAVDAISQSRGEVVVTLTGAAGGTISDAEGSGRVLNDPSIFPLVVSIADAEDILESQSASFPVSLNRAPPESLSVAYTVSYTGPRNYTGCTTTCPALVFLPDGSTTQSIILDTIGDVSSRETGTFTVTLVSATSTAPGGTDGTIDSGNGSATGRVLTRVGISVSDATSVYEGHDLVFRVELTEAHTAPIPLTWTLTSVFGFLTADDFSLDGLSETVTITNVAESDSGIEVEFSGTLAIAAGAISGTITLPAANDGDRPSSPIAPGTLDRLGLDGNELDDTVLIEIVPGVDTPRNVVIDDATATGTIHQAYATKVINVLQRTIPPTTEVFEIADSDVPVTSEGNTITFEIFWNGIATVDTEFEYTLDGPGSTASAADFHPNDRAGFGRPGRVTMLEGHRAVYIRLRTLVDDISESRETVVIQVKNLALREDLSRISHTTAKAFISNVAPLRVEVSGSSEVAEGESLRFGISLNRASAEALLVRYRFLDPASGAALDGDDFVDDGSRERFTEEHPSCRRVDISGSFETDNSANCLWIPASRLSVQGVNLQVLDDGIYEGVEEAIFQIVDVCVAQRDPAAPGEFVEPLEPCAVERRVQFSPGQIRFTVVDIGGQIKFRPHGGRVTPAASMPSGGWEAANRIVTEGNTAYFTVALSGTAEGGDYASPGDDISPGAFNQPMTVDYVIRGTYNSACRTAALGVDYSVPALSGTLVFQSRQTAPSTILTQTIAIDTHALGGLQGTRYVLIELSNPTGGAVLPTRGGGNFQIADRYRRATIEIHDDEAAPSVAVATSTRTIDGVSEAVREGENLRFTVTLSGSFAVSHVMTYSLGGDARAGVDYQTPAEYSEATGGRIEFPAGETSQDVVLNIADDAHFEENEELRFILSPIFPCSDQSGTTRTAIILNSADDPVWPDFSLGDVEVYEGDTMRIPVTLSAALGTNIALSYIVHRGNPATILDPNDGRLLIPSGATSAEIVLNTLEDSVYELDETVTVELDLPYLLENDDARALTVATGTILDDEPSVELFPADAEEGEDLRFRVVFGAPLGADTVISYSLGGTATYSDDYTDPLRRSLRVGTGRSAANIVLNTVNDSVREGDESVVVTLNIPGLAGDPRIPGPAAGTIADNDPIPTVSIEAISSTAAEGRDALFAVRLSNPTEQSVSISYVTGGTATVGADYVDTAASAGVATFAPRQTSRRIILATMTGDGFEEDETVTVTIGADPDGNAVLGTENTATVTLQDGDGPPSVWVSDSPPAVEGQSLSFTVTMSGTFAETVTVSFNLGGTAVPGAAADYVPPALNTVTIAPGSSTATIMVATRDDTLAESDETVVVTLLGAALPAGSASTVFLSAANTAVGTILDNESPPVVSISLTSQSPVVEGGTLIFTVTLASASARVVTVPYTIGGTSDAADYTDATASQGSVTIPPLQRSGTITIEVTDDSESEADETVTVNLSAPTPSGAAILGTPASATGVIRDNDGTPEVSVAAVGPAVEGQNLEFRVSLSAVTGQRISVAYTLGGTAGSSDYSDSTGGSVVFMAGDIMKTISLATAANDGEENDETVQVTLAAPLPSSAAILSTASSATGVIRDGDVSRFTISSPSVVEGNSGSAYLEFTVDLIPASNLAATVSYSVTGGTADEGTDYAALPSGTLGFQAGETSKTIAVEVFGDTEVEADETVMVSLSNPTSGAIVHRLRGVGTGTIGNDDLGFSIDSPSVVESGAGIVPLVFTVTLGARLPGVSSVEYSVSGGTATEGDDYQPLPGGLLTFASCQLGGGCEQAITVTVIGDVLAEENETVEITLFNARGGVDIEPGGKTGVGTILSESVSDATVSVERAHLVAGNEADDAAMVEFEVHLSRPLGYEVLVQYRVRSDAAGQLYSGTAAVAPRETEEHVRLPLDTRHAISSLGSLYIDVAGVSGRGLGIGGLPEVEGTLRDGIVVAAEILSVATERREVAAVSILAGFGRSLGTSIVGMVWDRVNTSMLEAGDSHMRLGGRNVDPAAFAASEDAGRGAKEIARALGIEVAAVDDYSEHGFDGFRAADGGADEYRKWAGLPEGDKILSGADFALTVRRGRGKERRVGLFTVWGKGSVSSYENASRSTGIPSIEGNMSAGHIGMDYRFQENLLLGIALSQSGADTDYSFAGVAAGDGRSKISFEIATPYFHINSPGGPGVWGSVSSGSGTLELRDSAGTVESDVSLQAFAGGFHSGHAGTGGRDLAVKADVYTAKMASDEGTGDGSFGKLDTDVSRLRLALENAGERTIQGGASLRSRIELGARYDLGDAQEGGGADVEGEFGFISFDGSVEIKGRGNMLLVHEQKGISEWGIGLGATYTPGTMGRGVRLTLEPTWNAPRRAASDSLWERASVAGDADEQGAAYRARLAYGLGALDERAFATVYGEVRDASESRRLRLGTELSESDMAVGVFRFDVYGEREEHRSSGPDSSLMLEGSLRF